MMTKDDNKRSIESQLNCKATAALDNQIADELKLEDRPLSELIDPGKLHIPNPDEEEEEGEEEENAQK
jgi:hypothetical protein